MFRKSFFVGIVTVCVAVVAGYGVSKSVNNDTDLEVLTLGNVEALAGGEGFWDGVKDGLSWWGDGIGNTLKGQGWTKDEEKVRESCNIIIESSGSGSASYGGGSASGSGSHRQVNPSNRTDIRCTNGNENCTPIDC